MTNSPEETSRRYKEFQSKLEDLAREYYDIIGPHIHEFEDGGECSRPEGWMLTNLIIIVEWLNPEATDYNYDGPVATVEYSRSPMLHPWQFSGMLEWVMESII